MTVKRTAAAVVLGVLLCMMLAQPSGAYPAGTSASVSLSASCVDQGGTLNVFGQNFAPNASVTLSLGSVNLGTAQTDASGSLAVNVTIPVDVSAGSHSLTAISGSDTAFASLQVGCGGAPIAGSGGGLSETGVAVVGIMALAIVLLVGGLLMVFVGRKRKAQTV